MTFPYRLPRRIIFNTTVLILLCVVAASCSRPQVEERRYDLKGKIVSVDRAKGDVEVDHEEIPGFMAAMRMHFPVKDADALNTMEAGDTIQATLVVTDADYRLENIAVTKKLPGGSDGAAAAGGMEPQPGARVPDVTLVNQDGRSVKLPLSGTTTLVTFIYTRCPLPDQCPLMSANFAELKRELGKDPTLGQKVRLLSITLDPEYDTPKVLRDYASRYTDGDDAFERWDFLTGDPEQVRRVATFFGLMYKAENGQVIHSLRTAVVGPDGNFHKLYRGNEWKPDEALGDLRRLSEGK